MYDNDDYDRENYLLDKISYQLWRKKQQIEKLKSLEKIPDSYYEDPLYRKKETHLELLREERRTKKAELLKRRNKITRYYSELSNIRRAQGKLYWILAKMLEDSNDKKGIIIQLKAISSSLKNISDRLEKKFLK